MADSFYSASLVVYDSLELVRSFCFKYCKKYAFILHDKDECTPHIHLICTFSQRKSISTIRRYFRELGSTQNVLFEPVRDFSAVFRYLTHKDDATKYQYSDTDVTCNDYAFFDKSKQVSSDIYEFVNDLVDGFLTYREMAYKYGRDYIRNYQRYNDFAVLVRLQESRGAITDDSEFEPKQLLIAEHKTED